MPKMKTNRGAAKRFKIRSNGSVKRRRAFRNHILTKKAKDAKREKRPLKDLAKCDEKAVKRLLALK